jgi:hypothetical protein
MTTIATPDYTSKQLRLPVRQRLLAWLPCRHEDGTICVHRQWAYDHWARGFHKGYTEGTLRERRHQAEARLAAEDAKKKATP